MDVTTSYDGEVTNRQEIAERTWQRKPQHTNNPQSQGSHGSQSLPMRTLLCSAASPPSGIKWKALNEGQVESPLVSQGAGILHRGFEASDAKGELPDPTFKPPFGDHEWCSEF